MTACDHKTLVVTQTPSSVDMAPRFTETCACGKVKREHGLTWRTEIPQVELQAAKAAGVNISFVSNKVSHAWR